MSGRTANSDENQRALLIQNVEIHLLELLESRWMCSAHELLSRIEKQYGLEARWEISGIISRFATDSSLTNADRGYLRSLIEDGSLAEALRGEGAPNRELVSGIDSLIHQSRQYRSSKDFAELVEFMAKFREYAPYNNMLVRLQNPTCSFYATAIDWKRHFDRDIKEDARPMLILAPMHPVMLVYDLDQTEGKELPKELLQFAHFEGRWDPKWLERTLENASRHRIRVNFKSLSSTAAGFATLDRGTGEWKMRIAIHAELDEPSQLGVLCHELAHIFLGHLGTDQDYWWPGRSNITKVVAEIEAEAVAHIVMSRLGLKGSSAAYVSRYLKNGDLPAEVSPDMIAKVSGRIERMTSELMPPKEPREQKQSK